MSDSRTIARGRRLGIVLLSLVLLVLLTLLTFQIAVVRMPTEVLFGFGAGVPAMVPLIVLLASAALAGTGCLRRLGVTRRELMIIYSVLLVGVPLASRGVLRKYSSAPLNGTTGGGVRYS